MATSYGFGDPLASARPRAVARSADEIASRHDDGSYAPRSSIRAHGPVLQDCALSLTNLIETQIIPKLLVVQPVVDTPPTTSAPGPMIDTDIGPDQVESFATLALTIDAEALIEHVDSLQARGVTPETLLVDLLAPAARWLGERWEDDTCDFVDVTMALWRLQQVVHDFSHRLPADHAPGASARHALFAAAPGDQHGFGALVVEEVFARAGWLTDRMSEPTARDLADRVAAHWFDVIGLTVSNDCHTAALPSLIAAVRSVSRNPRLRVLVGGPVFVRCPGLSLEVGADGTAADARAAVVLAEALVPVAVRGRMAAA